jgi:UDP-N-acetylmuramoyl-tripeptide--D-alanyl-D-alanine ligase
MIELQLSQIAGALEGQLVGQDCRIHRVSTDTRSIVAGDLYVALKGHRFDGHQFIEDALAKGAVAVVVSENIEVACPKIIVDNTTSALGKIGAFVRQVWGGKIVGITGSSGKTTVRQLTQAIFEHVAPTLATQGNFNNEIGVPLTLLRLERQHQYGVIEMGANHMGEIEYSTQLVKPDVAMITNVAAAHLEGFGSVHNVARAKAEIYDGIAEHGTAIVNSDSSFANYWKDFLRDMPVKLMTFGIERESDVYARNIKRTEEGFPFFEFCYQDMALGITVPLPGEHNVYNALAAGAAALASGISMAQIQEGLSNVQPVEGRVNIRRGVKGCRIIDDSYNANIGSVTAAIKLLASYPDKRILVLGDMAELGNKCRHYHQLVGEMAKDAGLNELYTLGELSQFTSMSFGNNARHFSHLEPLLVHLNTRLDKNTTLLVKGSRSARTERVVEALMDASQAPEVIEG